VALEVISCTRNHLTALDLSGLALLDWFWGIGQTVSLTLYNNGSGTYELPIPLLNPEFEHAAIKYIDGKIQTTNTTIATTGFLVTTNNPGNNLEGLITFTYSEETPEPPVITTTTLPNGTTTISYSATLAATGTDPITWEIADGDLPAGLLLNAATGEIFGSPNTAGTFSFTAKATNYFGTDSKVLAITVTTVGIVETPLMASLRVYPNPTNGQLIIDNGELTIENVEIYDMMGRTVGANLYGRPNIGRPQIGQSEIGQSEIVLDVSGLPSGVYILRIGTQTAKFIKK
jgi:hypothetical protein